MAPSWGGSHHYTGFPPCTAKLSTAAHCTLHLCTIAAHLIVVHCWAGRRLLYIFSTEHQSNENPLQWSLQPHWVDRQTLYRPLHLLNSAEKRKWQISDLIDGGRKYNCSYQFGANWYWHRLLSTLIDCLGNMSAREERNLRVVWNFEQIIKRPLFGKQ